MTKIFLNLILFYRKAISPFSRPSCRFFPTCSEYAYMATQQHGIGKGLWLTCKRLVRCHPWGGSGIDYPPSSLDKNI